MRAIHILPAVILVASLPAHSQPTPAASAPAPAQAAPAEPEKLICRKQIETGSLVRGKKTCMTRTEWAKVGDAARDGSQYLLEQNEGRPAGQ